LSRRSIPGIVGGGGDESSGFFRRRRLSVNTTSPDLAQLTQLALNADMIVL